MTTRVMFPPVFELMCVSNRVSWIKQRRTEGKPEVHVDDLLVRQRGIPDTNFVAAIRTGIWHVGANPFSQREQGETGRTMGTEASHLFARRSWTAAVVAAARKPVFVCCNESSTELPWVSHWPRSPQPQDVDA